MSVLIIRGIAIHPLDRKQKNCFSRAISSLTSALELSLIMYLRNNMGVYVFQTLHRNSNVMFLIEDFTSAARFVKVSYANIMQKNII